MGGGWADSTYMHICTAYPDTSFEVVSHTPPCIYSDFMPFIKEKLQYG